MWEYSVNLGQSPKKGTWQRVGDHYFKWSCTLQSYWKGMNLANNHPRAKFLGWNTVSIDNPNQSTELHQFVCLPGSVQNQNV